MHKKLVHLQENESENHLSVTFTVCFLEALAFILLLLKHFTAGEQFLIASLRSIALTISHTTFAIQNT